MYKITMEYAHHSHGESDELGFMSGQEAIEFFENFDWKSEIIKANELQKVSPTLSLADNQGKRFIWVSGFGDPVSPEFVSDCSFPGEVSSLFGLVKKQGTVSLSASGFGKVSAKKALELFVAKNEKELRELYK